MTTTELLNRKNPGKALIVFILCLVLLIAAEVTASLTQQDFGRVEVSNVTYQNYNGIPIRAKLLRPEVVRDRQANRPKRPALMISWMALAPSAAIIEAFLSPCPDRAWVRSQPTATEPQNFL